MAEDHVFTYEEASEAAGRLAHVAPDEAIVFAHLAQACALVRVAEAIDSLDDTLNNRLETLGVEAGALGITVQAAADNLGGLSDIANEIRRH